LRHRVTEALNIEVAVDEIEAILDQACRSSFMQTGPTGKALRYKSIPWWTSRLTTQRKEVNANYEGINEGRRTMNYASSGKNNT
jgi:hypothetical protein